MLLPAQMVRLTWSRIIMSPCVAAVLILIFMSRLKICVVIAVGLPSAKQRWTAMIDPLSYFIGCVIGFVCGYLGRKLYGFWYKERYWYEAEERKTASE